MFVTSEASNYWGCILVYISMDVSTCVALVVFYLEAARISLADRFPVDWFLCSQAYKAEFSANPVIFWANAEAKRTMRSRYRTSTLIFASLVCIASVALGTTEETKESYRQGKSNLKNTLYSNKCSNSNSFFVVLPIFQVVRFPNDVCTGTTRNGTCFTA